MPSVVLFYRETCFYCQKVLNYLRQSGISVPTRSVASDPAARAELIKIGGKSQVPCLIINGKALYESDDIIQWFKTNWRDK